MGERFVYGTRKCDVCDKEFDVTARRKSVCSARCNTLRFQVKSDQSASGVTKGLKEKIRKTWGAQPASECVTYKVDDVRII